MDINKKELDELLEYIEIDKLIREREAKDDGVRYSLEQVKEMFKYE